MANQLTDQELAAKFDAAAKMHTRGVQSFTNVMIRKGQTMENPTNISVANAIYNDFLDWKEKPGHKKSDLALYMNLCADKKVGKL